MKFALKLILCAILSFSVGIACASPLLVSELNIRPWIKYVQGPTAEMAVEVVYANFTVQNANEPIREDSGPTILYYVVVNMTNPSDFGATVLTVEFLAAQQITNNSANAHPANGGEGWQAEGAWVDGKWYNLTWVNVSYPSFYLNDNMSLEYMPKGQEYWMEGVQVYDRYVNGTLATTYLNMNGTWTDVTGKITVNRPQQGRSYSANGVVANEMHFFENIAGSNGTTPDSSYGAMQMKHHLVGEGLFNNYWGPHQSRLFVLSGSWDVHKPSADNKTIAALQSGNLMLKTEIMNFVMSESGLVNNTATDTSSYAIELKQVYLTQTANSYVYTTLHNPAFQTDQWGLEGFL